MENKNLRRCFYYSSLALAIVSAAPVYAAGTLVSELSKQHASTAGAGGAVLAEDATVAYGNPAGMSYIDHSMIAINIAVMDLKVEYDDNADSTKNVNNAGKAQPYGSIHWVYPIDDKFRVGASIVSTGGSQLDYGTQYPGKLSLNKLKLTVVQFNPVVSYKIDEQWSIGGGVQVDYAKYKEDLLLNHAQINTDSVAWGGNLGVMYQVDANNRLGLTYRSKMDHDLTGDVDVKVSLPGFSSGLSGQAGISLINPAQLELSGLHQLSQPLSLVWSLGFENWSQNSATTVAINSAQVTQIERKFSDIWSAAIGARYQLTPKWRLETGIGYTSSPQDDAALQQADLPEDTQKRIGVGATYAWSDKISLNGYYSYVDYGDPKISSGNFDGKFNNSNQFIGVLVNIGL